jgi:hypothetical protein
VNEIKVSPAVQLAILGTLVAAILAVLAAEAPELRRYFSIRSM